MRGARIIVQEDDHGLAVYLRDAGCEFWRVYDVAYGPPVTSRGKRAVFPPPHAQATERWFVTRAGDTRVYTFGPKDRRELEPRLLMSQLTGARLRKKHRRLKSP